MRVNGTLMNYFFHCKRQCYLHGNRLNLEDNSEQVKIGKALHEERDRKENTEIALENIRLDKLSSEYLTEVKKSDADVEAAKWQLLLYLKILKDNSLCFRKNGKNVYIPIENTKEIYCLNEVSFNTKLLDFLSQNNVIVHFFNYYEGYSGTFYPKEKYLSGKLLVKQVEAFQNNRLHIAKRIVGGIGENIYEVLYHYYKHDKKEIKETLDWIRKEFYQQVEKMDNIKSLMAVEGDLWTRFYSSFQYFRPI